MRRRREQVFHIAELDRLLALSEATRRVVRDGHRNPRERECERIVDPDSGEHVWRIVFEASCRRRKERR